jgi:glycosyltransferase involved in cell wall biosynthesis
MRVGVKMLTEFGLVSIRSIARSFYESLAARHELVFLPHAYPYVDDEERRRMAEEFIQKCDVVAGLLDADLVAARRRLGSSVPFAFFTFGDLPLGAWLTRRYVADLTTHDAILVNASADRAIAHKFFANAQVHTIPFAYDPAVFYPLDPEARRTVRAGLRIGDGDRVILYAGRINPEKSVHTLISIFALVSKQLPGTHLVLAGTIGEGEALKPLNVFPVWYLNTLSKTISMLKLTGRLHLVGPAGADRLRDLYNAADVMVNLTLNPDENFGLAQVEAMACGTPVIGTAWGGLKDTIVDGVTGYKVSTLPTPTGVKLSWWEAANRIVALLEDRTARERMRAACLEMAGRYTQARYTDLLETALTTIHDNRDRPAEPLRPTPFAERFWSVCDPAQGTDAPFRRGPESEEMYRELVAPFAGVTPNHVPPGAELELEQVLSLATAVDVDGSGRVHVNHVLYPFPVQVPVEHLDGVHAILDVLREEPAITVERLAGTRLNFTPELFQALSWMLEAGLVLRTRAVAGWMDPETVDTRLSQSLITGQSIDRDITDLLVMQ